MKEKYGDDFNYELSCDQMCGAGHYTMRGVVIVESQAEFNVWLAKQQNPYEAANTYPTTPATDSIAKPIALNK